jgi:hypothetical protein
MAKSKRRPVGGPATSPERRLGGDSTKAGVGPFDGVLRAASGLCMLMALTAAVASNAEAALVLGTIGGAASFAHRSKMLPNALSRLTVSTPWVPASLAAVFVCLLGCGLFLSGAIAISHASVRPWLQALCLAFLAFAGTRCTLVGLTALYWAGGQSIAVARRRLRH